MSLRLTFLGAAGTVTGSKYLLEIGSRRILIDCGLFQGLKRLRERNWQPLPLDPKALDAIVLTHAHLDHTGYLPVLVRAGFRGPIYCTQATRDLLAILLPDSARLQEEEAQFANRHRFSKHSPALPLYTEADAQATLQLVRPLDWTASAPVAAGVTARFSPAGHLLGAASVLVESASGRVLFSGDVGRPDDLLMRPPFAPPAADWVVIESTYGDRRHVGLDAESELGAAINRATRRGGVIVIPAFAIGRAQLLLHLIARLKASRTILDVPVFLNSPMATDATRIYHAHHDEHRLSQAECAAMFTAARFVNTVEESKHLNTLTEPMIIISASGMATGGRVLHHLKAFASDARNLILFSGYQAAGTRGAALVGGAETIKIHGEWIPVRAEVVQLRSTSGHADCDQLVAWLKSAAALPERVFVTHGEPAAADALRQHLRRELGMTEVTVAEHGETVTREVQSAAARAYAKG
jgi:metallo-beta-lactamase family protein